MWKFYLANIISIRSTRIRIFLVLSARTVVQAVSKKLSSTLSLQDAVATYLGELYMRQSQVRTFILYKQKLDSAILFSIYSQMFTCGISFEDMDVRSRLGKNYFAFLAKICRKVLIFSENEKFFAQRVQTVSPLLNIWLCSGAIRWFLFWFVQFLAMVPLFLFVFVRQSL